MNLKQINDFVRNNSTGPKRMKEHEVSAFYARNNVFHGSRFVSLPARYLVIVLEAWLDAWPSWNFLNPGEE